MTCFLLHPFHKFGYLVPYLPMWKNQMNVSAPLIDYHDDVMTYENCLNRVTN